MGDWTVLIGGSGAREHVLAEAYARSGAKKIVVAPGNDFIRHDIQSRFGIEVALETASLKDPETIVAAAKKHSPDLCDVAQDDLLALGAVNRLKEEGFRAFGPTKLAARIEADKQWSRNFMRDANIPTPRFKSFSVDTTAKQYVDTIYDQNPDTLLYVKATGLCAGKGALPGRSREETYANIEAMKSFKEAGQIFLIEEGLVGEEFSIYAISDGLDYKLFPSAQDNKLSHNGDTGKQTGGMGSISPARVTRGLEKTIEDKLIRPAIHGMEERGTEFVGILYASGMLTDDGRIAMIEYNSRWGDPEVQTVLPGFTGNYADLVSQAIAGDLGVPEWLTSDGLKRVCVVGAADGYPDASKVAGKEILGLGRLAGMKGITVYGAGIKMDGNRSFANGGRLFSIVAEGQTIGEANYLALEAMKNVSIDGGHLHYRTDIGHRDVTRERNATHN